MGQRWFPSTAITSRQQGGERESLWCTIHAWELWAWKYLDTAHTLARMSPVAHGDRYYNLHFTSKETEARKDEVADLQSVLCGHQDSELGSGRQGSRPPSCPGSHSYHPDVHCSARVSWQLRKWDFKRFIFYCLPIWKRKNKKERISFFSTYYSHMFILSSPLECKLQFLDSFHQSSTTGTLLTPFPIKTFSFKNFDNVKNGPLQIKDEQNSKDNYQCCQSLVSHVEPSV